MITEVFTRGNLISWRMRAIATDGSPAVPGTATLRVSYTQSAGGSTTDEIGMTLDGVVFVGEWDSSLAARGLVEWTINTEGPQAADDGQFIIKANGAG